MERVISRFREQYEGLSNFAPYPVRFGGILYAAAENAYQAQKTVDNTARKNIAAMTPSEAKKACGPRGHIALRMDWEDVKYQLMRKIVEAKFRQQPSLQELLLSTGYSYLEEGNSWHDNEWGACQCGRCAEVPKKNRLGIILMEIREVLRCEKRITDAGGRLFMPKSAEEQELDRLRDKVRRCSFCLNNTANDVTRQAYDDAIEELMAYEKLLK